MSDIKLGNIPTGNDGEADITVNGKIEQAFKIAKVSTEFETIKETRRFLNSRMSQSAVRGGNGKGNLSYFHTTSAFIKAMRDYKNGGAYPNITIQYNIHSPEYGRCEVVLREVVLDTVGFGALDDSSETSVIIETGFTFNDFDILEEFK